MSNFKQNPQLNVENPFVLQFEQFQATTLFQRLEKKFTPLPYYKKYQPLYWVTLIASFLFNILSGITASTLIYFFIQSISNNWVIATACTVLFLALLEMSKRKTNSFFFKDLLQYKKCSLSLLITGMVLMIVSITFSYFGSKKIVQELHTPTALINVDSLTAPLQNQIAQIDNQIANARATKWHGTTTTASQRTIETLTLQKTNLQNRLLQIQTSNEAENTVLTRKYQETVLIKSEYFALVTLSLELAFICCAFYLEYYDFRSFAEFAQLQNIKLLQSRPIAKNTELPNLAYTSSAEELHSDNSASVVQNSAIKNSSKSVVEKAIKQVKSRIASAEYRLRNNIGREETSIFNINKFSKELQNLESILHKQTT